MLGELQSRVGRNGVEINLLLLPGAEIRFLGCPARSVVAILT
jgi:hypothetical protein